MIEQAIAYIGGLLEGNEFFQGGFVLALLGTVAVWGRQLPAKVWTLLKRFLIVDCDVQERDDAFKAIVGWLADQPYGKRVKRFTVTVKEDRRGNPSIMFSPAPGTHWIWYHRWLVKVDRGREKLSLGNGNAISGFYESFTIQTLGWGRQVLEDLVNDAVRLHTEQHQGRTRVEIQDGFGGWDELGAIPMRPLESVVLPEGKVECTVQDMKRFLASEDWYGSLGIPYRRGYLFHGPPGTGKSSFCMALAGHLDLSLSVVQLSDPKLTDSQLAKMLSRTRRKSILLLEDVDCLYDDDRRAKDAEGVTLSGLLNALDGAQAQTGRMVILTTNYLDKLDPALVRPGRADVVIAFELASTAQIEEMFMRFFPLVSLAEVQAFAKSLGDQVVSPAEVQGILLDRLNMGGNGTA